MTAPIKAPKTPKNQPVTFQETIAPASVYSPAPALAGFHLSDRQQRLALIAAWVAAMLFVGVAVGWRMVAWQTPAAAPAGAPVAAGNVSVSTLSYRPSIAAPTAATPPTLTVQPSVAVTQAGVGSPFAVISAGTFQPADAPDALQPGFQSEVAVQGNLGTDPVR